MYRGFRFIDVPMKRCIDPSGHRGIETSGGEARSPPEIRDEPRKNPMEGAFAPPMGCEHLTAEQPSDRAYRSSRKSSRASWSALLNAW